MRISDWSSDVCSSDLLQQQGTGGIEIGEDARQSLARQAHLDLAAVPLGMTQPGRAHRGEAVVQPEVDPRQQVTAEGLQQVDGRDVGRAAVEMKADRKSVVWGKRVSVRVDLGGRRTLK